MSTTWPDGAEDLDLHAVGRAGELEAADAAAVRHGQPVALQRDVVAHQRRALQRLHLHELARSGPRPWC